MTLLDKYKKAFENLKTETIVLDNKIKLNVWSESLITNKMVKNTLEFNLNGSEIYKEPTIDLF